MLNIYIYFTVGPQCDNGKALTGVRSEFIKEHVDYRYWVFQCTKILDVILFDCKESKTCPHGIRYCNKVGRQHKWSKDDGYVVIGIRGQW